MCGKYVFCYLLHTFTFASLTGAARSKFGPALPISAAGVLFGHTFAILTGAARSKFGSALPIIAAGVLYGHTFSTC